ncbi:CaiB/BaiF CoA transferase family protein, partial [Chloroflexota bacterium]
MPKTPFQDIKIVELTNYIAAPLITRYLSDLGAEVIKIEGRGRPDPERSGRLGDDFLQNNTGKLDIALNLRNPKGVEITKKLVARADIVVENFAGGVMARLGLGYEDLKKVKPDIIMISSCMQGQTGPWAQSPGLGSHLAGLMGFNEIAGWPDREPAELGVYTDYVAPQISALAIMAALDYRRRTGKGQYFDFSQGEASLHFLGPLLLDYSVNKRVATRMGNRYPYAAPHNAYRCRGEDRWCAIAVFTDEEW